MIDIAKLNKFGRELAEATQRAERYGCVAHDFTEACRFDRVAKAVGMTREERLHYMMSEGAITPQQAREHEDQSEQHQVH